MWCPNCRSDVAAEVSTDNRHVNCANCGGPIATPLSGRTLSRTQQARDLLERWSRDRTPEPAATNSDAARSPHAAGTQRATPVYAIQQEAAVSNVSERMPPQRSGREASSPQRRWDDGHVADDSFDGTHSAGNASLPSGIESDSRAKRPIHRFDDRHAVAGPHVRLAGKSPTKWVSLIGQSLAYVGVLGLMAGACLVILGYFRGPATYAPTGWLITMAGQMLLFLGVVTLVSNGMEETTNTVANRIDRLDEKLLRIEAATSQLRGPRGGTDGYSTNAATVEPSSSTRDVSRAG